MKYANLFQIEKVRDFGFRKFVCLFVLNLDFDDSCSLVSPDPEELEIFYHLKPGSFD